MRRPRAEAAARSTRDSRMSGRRAQPTEIHAREARATDRSRFYLGCRNSGGGRRRGDVDAARVERVTERVAEQVEAQHRRTDREPGEDGRPRCVAQEIEVASV